MRITLEMIEAARRAMLEAAFQEVPDEVAAAVKPAAIVTARKPRPRR
jgi:hypothetical protein